MAARNSSITSTLATATTRYARPRSGRDPPTSAAMRQVKPRDRRHVADLAPAQPTSTAARAVRPGRPVLDEPRRRLSGRIEPVYRYQRCRVLVGVLVVQEGDGCVVDALGAPVGEFAPLRSPLDSIAPALIVAVERVRRRDERALQVRRVVRVHVERVALGRED